MLKKLFLLLVFSFTLISCTSVPKDSAYYKENIKDFSQIKLQNGIPVILKNVPTSKITVIQMIIEGGTPLLSTDKSGLENVTLELMLHGCDLYSYEEIKKLEYEISYSLTMSSSKDYSVVRLKCIDKDFDTVFSLFADSVLNPLMQKEDFEGIEFVSYVADKRIIKVVVKDDYDTFDYVFLTHSDIDHSGNMNFILNNYKVDNFYRPKIYSKNLEIYSSGFREDNIVYDEIITTLKTKSITTFFCADGGVIEVGDSKIEIFTYSDIKKTKYQSLYLV